MVRRREETRLLLVQHSQFVIERPMDFAGFQRLKFHQHPAEPGYANSNGGSDIILHLPVLEYYASLCQHVTEFGTRYGDSTVALCSGCTGKVVSYDIEKTVFVDEFEKAEKPCEWEFYQRSTIDPGLEIEPTDLIFFDTVHTSEHLGKELKLHSHKSKRYLAFHDTFTCGEYDRSGQDPWAIGIFRTIREFIDQEAELGVTWETVYKTDRNNGLWILKRG